MLKLVVLPHEGSGATIEVRDEKDILRADVHVDVGDNKVKLVVSDHIYERDSDDPNIVIELLTDMLPKEKTLAEYKHPSDMEVMAKMFAACRFSTPCRKLTAEEVARHTQKAGLFDGGVIGIEVGNTTTGNAKSLFGHTHVTSVWLFDSTGKFLAVGHRDG